MKRTPLSPISARQHAKRGGGYIASTLNRGDGFAPREHRMNRSALKRQGKRGRAIENAINRARPHVRARSGGRCEIRWEKCQGKATQMHHRGGRVGVDHADPSIYRDACDWCHKELPKQRARAIREGHIIERNKAKVAPSALSGVSWAITGTE